MILSKFEAKLLDINPTERTRLNNLSTFNSSTFPGAEIARTFINSKYLWEAVKFEKDSIFCVATKKPYKLKRLLERRRKDYSYSLKILTKKDSDYVLAAGKLVFWELRSDVKGKFTVIVIKWKTKHEN